MPHDVQDCYVTGRRDECWPWRGTLRNGYGQHREGLAHRVVYELLVGPIPDGFHIDHLCHTRATYEECQGGAMCQHRRCVNPAHMEAVPPAENGRRGGLARRDRCGKGHPLVAIQRKGDAGPRTCLTCEANRQSRIRDQRRNGERPQPREIVCADCGKSQPLCARGLCRRCYTRWYRAQRTSGVP